MEFDAVAAAVGGVPFMTPAFGRRVYDHIREQRPQQVLELGTAHGVSAAYMAAALEANGSGQIVTLDHGAAAYDPSPESVLERAGLSHRVTLRRGHSSYNWYLLDQIAQRSDAASNCDPLYDFCYLDGCHNVNVDGLAVVLVEKLLRPGGWLLMDDLGWAYERNAWHLPDGVARPLGPLSEEEVGAPQMRRIWDAVVRPHPSFSHCVIEDDWYGWAHKDPAAARRYEVRTSRPLGALVASALRRQWRRRGRRAPATPPNVPDDPAEGSTRDVRRAVARS